MRTVKVVYRRCGAFLLALLLFFCSPISDYLYVRDVYAMNLATTAVEFVFNMLFHAIGVKVVDNTTELIQDIWDWIQEVPERVEKYAKVMMVLGAVTWHTQVKVTNDAIEMLQEYFKSKGDYGTETGMDNITIGSMSLIVNPNMTNSEGRRIFVSDFTDDVYFAVVLPKLPSSPSESAMVSPLFISHSPFTVNVTNRNQDFEDSYVSNEYTYNDSTYYFHSIGWYVYGLLYGDGSLKYALNGVDYIPYNSSGYDRQEFARDFFNDFLDFDGLTKVPVESIPDIQTRSIQIAGEISIPATAEEAYAKYIDFSAATTADEMASALAGTVDITYGDKVDTGEKDDTYPWVPDITSPLNGILDKLGIIADGLSGLKDWITDIPKKLADIKDGVISIPGQIADFFSVDTAQVDAAQASLSVAFQAKFSAFYGFDKIFNFKKEFDDTIPVISIAVPDFLQYAFPNQDRIIILDLRPYEDKFRDFRLLISAILWICFIYWVIEQFDVKFGIN